MKPALSKALTIYLESNPNPNSLKFVVSDMLVPDGYSYDFPGPDEAAESALAQELFGYPFVDRVFIAANFVTVTKKEDVEWIEIQNILKQHILSFLEAGRLVVEPAYRPAASPQEETEIIKQIKSILDEYIRPAVEQDGGAIAFHSFEEGTVRVRLQGSCSGCPSSTITLKAGIENLFKRMMPDQVKAVESLS